MNDIQIFNNPEFGEIRTVEQNGEPWFVGKDVALALGYADAFGALKKHVDDVDKQNCQNDSFESPRGMTIINESGLYSLCFGSKLEGAKRFKRWVTSEVLPSIRKTGSYMAAPMSKELQAIFVLDNRTVQHEKRICALENSMVVDYEQQRVLRRTVNHVVVEALGGKDSPAYLDKSTRCKVYSECNKDAQDWFHVNSVSNIPRKRFDEAVEYIQRWKPSTNTVMLIQNVNGQTKMFS